MTIQHPTPVWTLHTFVNTLYMSHKQFGIQTAHLVGELSNKYLIDGGRDPRAVQVLKQYLSSAEPYIHMRDGMCVGRLEVLQSMIQGLAEILHLPYGSFYESHYALAGALTVTGLVIPDDMLLDRKTETVFNGMSIDELAAQTTRLVEERDDYVTKGYTYKETARHLLSELIRQTRFAN